MQSGPVRSVPVERDENVGLVEPLLEHFPHRDVVAAGYSCFWPLDQVSKLCIHKVSVLVFVTVS